jgi:hypothetical protein
MAGVEFGVRVGAAGVGDGAGAGVWAAAGGEAAAAMRRLSTSAVGVFVCRQLGAMASFLACDQSFDRDGVYWNRGAFAVG